MDKKAQSGGVYGYNRAVQGSHTKLTHKLECTALNGVKIRQAQSGRANGARTILTHTPHTNTEERIRLNPAAT